MNKIIIGALSLMVTLLAGAVIYLLLQNNPTQGVNPTQQTPGVETANQTNKGETPKSQTGTDKPTVPQTGTQSPTTGTQTPPIVGNSGASYRSGATYYSGASGASPSRANISSGTIDDYLLSYVNYNYQYKVTHNYITSFTTEFYQGCQAANGKGAIYTVNYQNRYGNNKSEYYFIGVKYTEGADGTLQIYDVDDESDDNIYDIYEEAFDEGFACN